MSTDNLIGNYIREVVDRGDMVDNYITHYLILTSLHIARKNDKYVMIDGFPRVMEQANFFIEKEAKLERDFVVIQYVLSKETKMQMTKDKETLLNATNLDKSILEMSIPKETMSRIKVAGNHLKKETIENLRR
jgi:adenylate kinase family enzyme